MKRRQEQGSLFEIGNAWEELWRGMPEFVQDEQKPLHTIDLLLRSEEDKAAFEALAGRIYHDKWLWYPPKGYANWRRFRWQNEPPVMPRFPVYVPTKGRWETPFTIRTFEALGVPFRAVVEAQEAEAYARVVADPSCILVLPHRDKGLVATRNWIWDHAAAAGARKFWTFDDNIQGLYRLNRNAKIQPTSGVFLRAIEDWADRYSNLPVVGMQYELFASRRERHPPLCLNARVYSNMLIETDYREEDGRPFRNEGFYNDDTDLCLRIFKRGHCTALFYAFLINKIATMTVSGGMTTHYRKVGELDPKWRELAEEVHRRGLYQSEEDAGVDEERLTDGRWRMAAELAAKHPDVTRISRKWGRWQHHVDYTDFERNRLAPVPGLNVPPGINDYGMRLVEYEKPNTGGTHGE